MEERIIFKIEDDVTADETLELREQIQEEINRLEKIKEGRIARIEQQTAERTNPLREQIMNIDAELRAYFSTLETKNTKTQRKYVLPSGTLIEKKQQPEFKRNDENLVDW